MTSNPATTTPRTPPLALWTPASSGPGRARRLFFTPSILTNFQANWTDPYANSAGGPIKSIITPYAITGTNVQSPVANALTYLANPAANVSFLNTAVAQALAVPYGNQYVDFTLQADPSAFVLDWGYPDISPTNRAALISQINTNMSTHITNMATSWNVSEPQRTGYQCIIFSALAIQGESGASDWRAQLRNITQNCRDTLDEMHGGGLFASYNYAEHWAFYPFLAYEIATGQSLNFQFLKNRGEVAARLYAGKAIGYNPWVGDQVTSPDVGNVLFGGSGGGGFVRQAGPASMAYAIAKIKNDGLWQWIGDQCIASGMQNTWGIGGDNPCWLGVAYWDNTITATPPSSSFLRKNYVDKAQRGVNFRSNWATPGPSNVDVRVWLGSPPFEGHSRSSSGMLDIFRGSDDLCPRGAAYIAEGNTQTFIYTGGIASGKAWSNSSFAYNTLTFATGTATPDTDGAQQSPPQNALVARQTLSSKTWCPRYFTFGNTTINYRNGEITCVDFPAGDAYGMAHVDFTETYEPTLIASCIRKVCCIPGASPGQMTIIVRDQFILAGSSPAVNVKWAWFARQKPTVFSSYSAEQTAGTATQGLIFYNSAALV